MTTPKFLCAGCDLVEVSISCALCPDCWELAKELDAEQARAALSASADHIAHAGKMVDADREQDRLEEPGEPYAWHYYNNAGGSTYHRSPCRALDADMTLAKQHPRVHHVVELFDHTHKQSTHSVDVYKSGAEIDRSEQDRLDAARLDFVLKNDAYKMTKKTDSGGLSYQLWSQDEDENFFCFHDEKAFFSSARLAIDAAIAQAKEPKP